MAHILPNLYPSVGKLTMRLVRIVNEQAPRLAERIELESVILEAPRFEPLQLDMDGDYFDVVEELDSLLRDADFQAEDVLAGAGWRSGWGLPIGVAALGLTPRPIHNGFLRAVVDIPIVTPASDRVVAYLIALPGNDDFLDREHHSFLWHYHYLDARKRRSNVILCWDTRQDISRPTTLPTVRALFQEHHGEGKNTFPARPDLWGDYKKETMHQAAYPDLRRWSLKEFRCASNKSGPVWPLGAVLTPRGALPADAGRGPAKARRP